MCRRTVGMGSPSSEKRSGGLRPPSRRRQRSGSCPGYCRLAGRLETPRRRLLGDGAHPVRGHAGQDRHDGVGELFVAFGGDRAGCHCVDRADPSAPMIPLMEPMLTTAPSPRCAIAGAMSPVSRNGVATLTPNAAMISPAVTSAVAIRLHEGGDVNRPCCAALLRLPARQSAGGVSSPRGTSRPRCHFQRRG